MKRKPWIGIGAIVLLIAALVVVGAIFYNIGISRGVATAANLEGFVFAGGPLSHKVYMEGGVESPGLYSSRSSASALCEWDLTILDGGRWAGTPVGIGMRWIPRNLSINGTRRCTIRKKTTRLTHPKPDPRLQQPGWFLDTARVCAFQIR